MANVFFMEVVEGVLVAPMWWYSRGLSQMVHFVMQSTQNYQEQLAVSIWLRNLFVPMYGSRDFTGRVISFVVRVAQIFVRSLFLLVYALAMILLLVGYFFLPFVILVELLIHLVGVFTI